jgi:hypothetical protein
MFRRRQQGMIKAARAVNENECVAEIAPLEPRLLMSAVHKAQAKPKPKPVVPVLTLNDIQVTEPRKGASTVQAVATLSRTTTATVKFGFATTSVTAISGKDFTNASGTINLKPGQRSTAIKLHILSDKIKESDEVFNVLLKSLSGATAARPFSRVVIKDPTNTTIRPSAVVTTGNVQSGSAAAFTVTLSSPAPAPVSFRFTTTAGSASTSQFRATTGIANIAAGQTATTISIPTTAGGVTSGTATFNLSLTSPANATITTGSATATIVPASSAVDNSGGNTSAGSATLSVNDASVLEGSSPNENSLVFTVSLSSAPVVPVTVQFFTSVDSTDPLHATPGVDYTDVSGTLTFNPGETSKTISVPIIGNTTPQGNRDIVLTLTNATSATFFRNRAVGTIIDDDNSSIVPSQADFNGDGKPDILFRDIVTGQMTVWFMDGTTRIDTATLAGPGTTNLNDEAIGTGDFNRDGHPDIVFKNTSTGAVTIWVQTGTNSLTTQRVVTVEALSSLEYKGASVGDFNNDGNPDILFRNIRAPITVDNPGGSTDAGKNMVWVMNGFTHASTQFLAQEPDNAFKVAGVGDFNGDGNLDVYFHNSSTGANSVWLLDGNFSRTSIVQLGNSGADTTVAVLVPRAVENLTGTSTPDIILRDANSGHNQLWVDSSSSNVATLPDDTDLNDQIVGSQTL